MIEPTTTIKAVRTQVALARDMKRTIGLVPTMGALHAGHVRLIEECRGRVDFTVVSIFVNPTQFAPGEDFDRYPRTFDADLLACEAAGVDLVFAPTRAEIYPRGEADSTFVEAPGISHVLEGSARPTHFRGVATVVLALFEIVRPDIAVFGQKDFQQQALIRRMVADLHVPVEVVTVPTVREPDGLALSSRNRYLSPEQRRGSVALFQALEEAKRAVAEGERDADRVRRLLRSRIESEETAELDYAEVVDALSLASLERIEPDRPAAALVAARFGATRLIDNVVLL